MIAIAADRCSPTTTLDPDERWSLAEYGTTSAAAARYSFEVDYTAEGTRGLLEEGRSTHCSRECLRRW